MYSITYDELRDIAKEYIDSGLHTIYCHWSAGHYDQPSSAYHISITGDGTVYLMNDLDDTLAATWRRNTGSINVSIMGCWDACCYGRDSVDLGSEPPTEEQIEAMAKVVCILCEELGFDISYDRVRTHAEQADIDGYGIDDDDPEVRWDLLLLEDSDGEEKPGGEVIRGKAIWYHYHPEEI